MIKEAYLRHIIFYFFTSTLLSASFFLFSSSHSNAAEIQYLFPLPDSRLHHPGTQIIIRFNHITPADIQNFSSFIRVFDGNRQPIAGMTSVSTDSRTISFMPYKPFEYGAQVRVTIKPRLYEPAKVLIDTSFIFHVVKRQQIPDRLRGPNPKSQIPSGERRLKKSTGRDPRVLNGVSVPSDFPEFDISINDNPDSGSIFLTTIREKGYALILDNQANPLFYWRQPSEMMSFKAQPDNRISVLVWGEEGQHCGPVAFDTTFSIVDTFCPPPGYWFDEHELVNLENGHYLLIASDERIIDMSQHVEGGWEEAVVRGNHVVEMDEADNPVIIWRSWDHFNITDAIHQELDAGYIDYVHMNSIEIDRDGNWVISSRHLSEVTKINRYTGEIMWRLGGKNDYFDWVNDDYRLSYQHDARSLPNGHYTIFDNGNFREPEFSRSLEVELDTVNWTATKVWEFRNTPDIFAGAECNTQRLNNGNTLINFGGWERPCLTEVRPDRSKAFEMYTEAGVYRCTRFHWDGMAKIPYLIAEAYTDRITLLFNKFGDPDVARYDIYGGTEPEPEQLMASTDKPFIHLTDLTNEETWFFRVKAVNSKGEESGFSNQEDLFVNIIPAGTNLVDNGDFSEGITGWDYQISEANATWDLTDDGEFKFVIFDGGSDFSQVRMVKKNILLAEGNTYLMEFEAFADENRIFEAELKSKNGNTNFSKMGVIELKKTKRQYSHEFVMEEPTADEASLFLSAGGSHQDVYIDNVSVVQVVTKLDDNKEQSASAFKLYPNYPNPFNNRTRISFTLPAKVYVQLEIFNVNGQKIQTLIDGEMPGGRHKVDFNSGPLPSGLYLYRLSTGSFQQVRKMLFVK